MLMFTTEINNLDI